MAKSRQNQSPAKDKRGQPGQQSSSMAGQSSSSAVELLKQDHRKVEGLFEEFEQAGDDDERQEQLAQQICKELMIHATIEEEIFYPACRAGAGEEDEDTSETLDEAQVEHDSAKILINEILHGDADDRFWKAKVSVLCDLIKHHVEEEEKPDEGVMAKAEESGIDTPDLANRLKRRKSELQAHAEELRPIRAVSLTQPFLEDMPRYRRAERGGYGRSMRDDDRDYRQPPRSRRPYDYDEDDDDRHGGWYGDPRGHAEASRRGWQHRR